MNYKQQFSRIRQSLRNKGYFPQGWAGIHQIMCMFSDSELPFHRDHIIRSFDSIHIPPATTDTLKVLEESPLLSNKDDRRERKRKATLRKFYSTYEWRKVRYKVLKKYGSKCMCCGSADRPIHVDHIKPLRKYWHLRLDPDNLQVLCEECNHGKGNWDETDFRPKLTSTRVRILRVVK
jgi:5-methylcytosine-specific restriction endonuclease McrA